MRCPNCNIEVDENEVNCHNCGAPLHHDDDDEPTISRGLVIFIIIGTIFLVAYGLLYYQNHKNDPEYTQTAIEPDSNLAEKNVVRFDTASVDVLAKDSMALEEQKEAEKVMNTIRGKNRHRNHSSDNSQSSESEEAPVIVPSRPEGGSNDAPANAITPTVVKPRVENVETGQ